MPISKLENSYINLAFCHGFNTGIFYFIIYLLTTTAIGAIRQNSRTEANTTRQKQHPHIVHTWDHIGTYTLLRDSLILDVSTSKFQYLTSCVNSCEVQKCSERHSN
jgi:hypothetical protein